MKTPTLLLLTCLCAFSPLQADDAPKTELGREMAGFGDLFKAMKSERDPSKGAELARKAQLHLARSIDKVPAMLKDSPAGPARDQALARYRKMITQTMLGLCMMEEAYLKGDLKEVSRLRTSLLDFKDKGHDEFVDE